MTFYVYHRAGYAINSVSYTVDGSTDAATTISNYGYYSVYGLSANITIKVDGDYVGEKTITYAGNENIDMDKSTLPTKGTPGDKLSFYPVAKDGYYIVKAEFSDSSISTMTYFSSYGSITMPKDDLTVTFTVKALSTISSVETTHVTAVHYYSDYNCKTEITGVSPSSSLYVVYTCDEGYSVTSLSANITGANIYSGSGINSNAFSLSFYNVTDFPAAIVLTPTVSQAHTVSFDTVDGMTFGFSSGFSATNYVGSTVRFTAVVSDGYELGSITAKSGETSVTVNSYYSANTYTITMPDADVVISAVVTKLEDASIIVTGIGGASSTISSWSLTGAKSKTTLSTLTTSTSGFYVTEYVNYSLVLANNSKTVTMSVSQSGTMKEYALTANHLNISGSFQITDASVKVWFTLADNTTVTPTVSAGDLSLSYKINNADVTDLTNVYTGDYVGVKVNDTVASTQKIVASVVIGSSSTPLSAGSDGYYTFTASADFTLNINLKTIVNYTLTVVNNTADDTHSAITTSSYVHTASYSPTIVTGENVFEEDTAITVYCGYYPGIKFDVTQGDTVLATGTGSINYTFDLKANTTVTFSRV
ncbi:MAG: hypothetical protein WCR56_01250 [Bacilli bacterium]